MEGGGVVSSEKQSTDSSTTSSYTYWVREVKQDAAPLPVPRKLTAEDVSAGSGSCTHLGSAWNKDGGCGLWMVVVGGVFNTLQTLEDLRSGWAKSAPRRARAEQTVRRWQCLHVAGTWEEKNLNKWATERIKELLLSVGSLEFSSGNAKIAEVLRCTGDAFLVMVRNKKRVGYTYEITLKVKGEWLIGEEKRTFKGNLDLAEFSFGELDDLQVEVRLNDEKDLLLQDKQRILQDMKTFLKPIREKLLEFETELKQR